MYISIPRLLAVFASIAVSASMSAAQRDAALASASVSERGPHHNVWAYSTREQDAQGNFVDVPHTYTELASGLNRWDDVLQTWSPASDEMVIQNGHAVASKAAFSVILAGDADDPVGTTDILLPVDNKRERQRFRTAPVGLAFTEVTTGKSMFVCELQSSGGILDGKTVTYLDAYGDIAALRCRMALSSYEQEIVLKQQLPDCTKPPFNMVDPTKVIVENWTQILESPPPKITIAGRSGEGGLVREEHQIDLGTMQFILGQAFSVSNDDANQSPLLNPNKMKVVSEWLTINGMTFLVERVDYSELIPKLGGLPKSTAKYLEKAPEKRSDTAVASTSSDGALKSAGVEPAIIRHKPGPSGLIARTVKSSGKMMASSKSPLLEKGFVLDYTLVSGASSYVFRSDATYYVTGDTGIGNAIFNGGAIIKFAPYTGTAGVPRLFLTGATCNTSMYRPVICTAKDDDSVGEIVSGSTGSPSGTYGYSAIHFYNNTNQIYLHDFHFRYHYLSLVGENTSNVEGRHLQFLSCAYGPCINTGTMKLGNVIIANGTYGLEVDSATLAAENITVVDSSTTLHSSYGNGVFNLTNSLWVGNSSFGSGYGTLNEAYNSTSSSSSTVYDQYQNGYYYLKPTSPFRQAGTSNIRPELAADLKLRTTFMPTTISSFGFNQVLSPIVPRDGRSYPDKGYHYDPVDYVVSGSAALSVGTLTLTNGVAIGFYGYYGIALTDPANFVSQGSPTNLNHLVLLRAIQEHPDGYYSMFKMLSLSNSSTTSQIKLRFTEVDMLAGSIYQRTFLEAANYTIQNVVLQDSQIFNASMMLAQNTSPAMTAALTNNVIEGCNFVLNRFSGNGLTVYGRNNLFRGGTLDLSYTTSGSNPGWELRDNLFDSISLSGGGTYVTNSHNAYYSTTALPNSGGSNITLSAVDYQIGTLGPYYYPSTGGYLSTLIDAGSRSASDAGLFHYTTSAFLPDGPELASTVDIGFHHVAMIYPLWAHMGFTSKQGANGWYYRYSSTSRGPPDSFLPIYDPTWNTGCWSGSGDTYCVIFNSYQHPGVVYDSVRTLVCPASGEITITGAATVGSPFTSDGVRIRVLTNSAPLLDWVTLPSYHSSTNINLVTTVTKGDQIDFQLNCVANNGNDSTLWDPFIAYTSIPNPAFYVLTDSNGNGIPDYLEDWNGNGVVDSGETDWKVSADSGLKVMISQPRSGAIIP